MRLGHGVPVMCGRLRLTPKIGGGTSHRRVTCGGEGNLTTDGLHRSTRKASRGGRGDRYRQALLIFAGGGMGLVPVLFHAVYNSAMLTRLSPYRHHLSSRDVVSFRQSKD